jgi:hypothetical protein
MIGRAKDVNTKKPFRMGIIEERVASASSIFYLEFQEESP